MKRHAVSLSINLMFKYFNIFFNFLLNKYLFTVRMPISNLMRCNSISNNEENYLKFCYYSTTTCPYNMKMALFRANLRTTLGYTSICRISITMSVLNLYRMKQVLPIPQNVDNVDSVYLTATLAVEVNRCTTRAKKITKPTKLDWG